MKPNDTELLNDMALKVSRYPATDMERAHIMSIIAESPDDIIRSISMQETYRADAVRRVIADLFRQYRGEDVGAAYER